eukprot:2025914-Amphidinium_carterae.1
MDDTRPQAGVFQGCRQWLYGLQALLEATKPKSTAKPRKAWMTEKTWEELVKTGTKAKQVAASLRHMRRSLLAGLFMAWRARTSRGWRLHTLCEQLEALWRMHYAQYLVHKVLHRLRRSHVRACCRKDKSVWMDEKCQQLRVTYFEDPNKHHSLLRNLMKWRPPVKPRYAVDEHRHAETVSELCKTWDAHWMKKLYAAPVQVPEPLLALDAYEAVGQMSRDAEEQEEPVTAEE